MYTKSISKIMSLVLLGSVAFIPHFSNAETHIVSGDLDHGAEWNQAGSPYILDDDIYVPASYALNIGKGVTVVSATSTGPHGITIDGSDFAIWGTTEAPVNIQGLLGIYLTHSNVEIKNAVFDHSILDLWQSTSTIENSIFRNAKWGISTRGSKIAIEKSKFINNEYGIASYKYLTGPFLMYKGLEKEENQDGIGGIGNAFDDMGDMIIDARQNIISVTDSVLVGNTRYGILNQTVNFVKATDNWWGNINGPTTDTVTAGDRMTGPANFAPWKDKDPDEVQCCSNVLFLPGIEASRLYNDTHQYLGTSTVRLWEPFGNSNLKKLALNNDGTSVVPAIYTSDIVDSALGFKDIYKSLVAMMNGVVAEKVINNWLPFPYDWRMNVQDIVNGQTKLATTSVTLIDTIESLAQNSKTGKVIIVAHSNGGLVAKALAKTLEERGGGNVIEKILNIAVPELGTPKSIMSMLHGYDQSIAGGLLASEKNVRDLSQNMLGAYGLLPSREFFERNPLKVISNYFSSSTDLFASTYDAVKNFLISNPFSRKSSTDTNIPLLLNPSLMNTSEQLHSFIDLWRHGTSTRVLSLIGWGLPTPEGISYSVDVHCSEKVKANCRPEYSPVFTDRGDGTVLVDSNASTSDESLYLNLKKLKKDTNKETNHADILESPETLNLVKKQITSRAPDNDYGEYITSTEPIDTDKWLTIQIFSPVDIDIYDNEGRHTGLLENFDPTKNFYKYETQIPLSYYIEYSDKKLIRLLYGNDYHIVLKGNDAGSVIIKTDVQQFDKVIASTTFDEVPVTPLMNAELIISTSTDYFATSSSMNIDMDGDGTTDFVEHTREYNMGSSTSQARDFVLYVESIKKVISSLKLSSKDESKWLKRIDKILKDLENRHYKKADKMLKKLPSQWFKKKQVNEDDKKKILEVFEEMLNRFENLDNN